MSQAHGFAWNGCEVIVVKYGVEKPPLFLNDLIGPGCPGNVVEVQTHYPLDALARCDWVVWNTYRTADQADLQALRSRGVRITKSFPRLFGLSADDDFLQLRSRVDSFDFVAFALRADFEVAKKIDPSCKSFGYVPRGFISKWLVSKRQTNEFRISVDGPVRPRSQGDRNWNAESELSILDNVISALQKVKRRPIVVTSSRVRLPKSGSVRLGLLPMHEFYRCFYKAIDLYIAAPLSRSRHSESLFLGNGYRGLYENQVVEAQIAGAMILAEKYTVIDELLAPQQPRFSLDFRSELNLKERVEYAMNLASGSHSEISKWAIDHHDSVKTCAVWCDKLKLCGVPKS